MESRKRARLFPNSPGNGGGGGGGGAGAGAGGGGGGGLFGFGSANNSNDLNAELAKYMKKPRKVLPVELEWAEPYTNQNVDPSFHTFDKCVRLSNTDKYYFVRRKKNGNMITKMEAANLNVIRPRYFENISDMIENPGIYTWILFTDGTFRAAITRPGEILTKHKNLWHTRKAIAANDIEVLIAGEALVDDKRHINYNFLSGTFMVPIGRKYIDKGVEIPVANYQAYLDKLFTDAGAAEVVFNSTTSEANSHIKNTWNRANLDPYLVALAKHYNLSEIYNSKDACETGRKLQGGFRTMRRAKHRLTASSRKTRRPAAY